MFGEGGGKMKKECGNCEHWMKKSSCPREAKGLKPSCGSWPCDQFTESHIMKKINEEEGHEPPKDCPIPLLDDDELPEDDYRKER